MGGESVFRNKPFRLFAEPTPNSHEEITRNFVQWDTIDVYYRGEVISATRRAHFAGISAQTLPADSAETLPERRGAAELPDRD